MNVLLCALVVLVIWLIALFVPYYVGKPIVKKIARTEWEGDWLDRMLAWNFGLAVCVGLGTIALITTKPFWAIANYIVNQLQSYIGGI